MPFFSESYFWMTFLASQNHTSKDKESTVFLKIVEELTNAIPNICRLTDSYRKICQRLYAD